MFANSYSGISCFKKKNPTHIYIEQIRGNGEKMSNIELLGD